MSTLTIGLRPSRAYDYLALAEVREKRALCTRHPERRAFLQAAARYARKKAAASAITGVDKEEQCGPRPTASDR